MQIPLTEIVIHRIRCCFPIPTYGTIAQRKVRFISLKACLPGHWYKEVGVCEAEDLFVLASCTVLDQTPYFKLLQVGVEKLLIVPLKVVSLGMRLKFVQCTVFELMFGLWTFSEHLWYLSEQSLIYSIKLS